MKKLLILSLFLLLLFCATGAYAANGDIIGAIYSTDIIADINNVPVESYSLNGKTAIILEDLAQHGANVVYNDAARTLIVNTADMTDFKVKEIKRGTVGSIVGYIYESDIKVYLNGFEINAFSLNGKMAAAIEEIGCDNAYSSYNAKYVWNGAKRTISLHWLTENFLGQLSQKLSGSECGYMFVLDGNQLTVTVDKFSKSLGFSTCSYENGPVYCDGMEVGYCFKSYKASFSENGMETDFLNNAIYIDWDKMLAILSTKEKTPPDYNEIMQYIETRYIPVGNVIDRIDTENYSFVYISIATTRGATQVMLYAGKDGTFINYADNFKSVSLHGNKFFDNLVIDKENEKVYFRYDKDYVIDLKTKELKPVM